MFAALHLSLLSKPSAALLSAVPIAARRSITNVIVINNLEPLTDPVALRQTMEGFGRVREMDFYTSGARINPMMMKGNCRVVFQSHVSAIAALDELNAEFFPGTFKRVFVTFQAYNKSLMTIANVKRGAKPLNSTPGNRMSLAQERSARRQDGRGASDAQRTANLADSVKARKAEALERKAERAEKAVERMKEREAAGAGAAGTGAGEGGAAEVDAGEGGAAGAGAGEGADAPRVFTAVDRSAAVDENTAGMSKLELRHMQKSRELEEKKRLYKLKWARDDAEKEA